MKVDQIGNLQILAVLSPRQIGKIVFHVLNVIHPLSATQPSNVMTQPSQQLNVLIYPLTETFLPNAIQQLDAIYFLNPLSGSTGFRNA